MSLNQQRKRRHLSDVTPEDRARWLTGLDSRNGDFCRYCVQRLVELADAPVGYIRCWPQRRCTSLQFTSTLAVLREWAEWKQNRPDLDDSCLVHLMFEEVDETRPPTIRTVAKRNAVPHKPSIIRQALDQLNATLKDAILDRHYGDDDNEFSDSEEDVGLVTLDREEFGARMQSRFAEVLEYITDTVAAAKTDFELAKCEEQVGRFLHEMRWDVLCLALDLRDPSSPIQAELAQSHPDGHQLPSGPHNAETWAKKYRRMKAAGL